MTIASPELSDDRLESIRRWLAEPEERGAELLGGEVVYKAMPDLRHGEAQGASFAALFNSFHRDKGSHDHPGGWWLSQEVDILLVGEGVRPDLCGWRRDRHPQRPAAGSLGVVTAAPDWICEVLSPSTAARDLREKRDIYLRAGVGHYWLIDPHQKSLVVLRRTDEGYLFVLWAATGSLVRAEPFDAVDISLTRIFGDD